MNLQEFVRQFAALLKELYEGFLNTLDPEEREWVTLEEFTFNDFCEEVWVGLPPNLT